MRNLISYYESHITYDNEVAYLKADIYNDNKIWYKKAYLEKCRHVLALSHKSFQTEEEREDLDKKVAICAKDIKTDFPFIEITLIM